MNSDFMSLEFWSDVLFFIGGACVFTGVALIGWSLL
jgi:hypothetical protein